MSEPEQPGAAAPVPEQPAAPLVPEEPRAEQPRREQPAGPGVPEQPAELSLPEQSAAPSVPEQRPPGHRRHRIWWALIILAGVLALLFILPSVVFTVPAGHAAVIWHRFAGGTDVRHVRAEGTRLKQPWDLATIYDIRLQTKSHVFGVLTGDGLRPEVSMTVRFRLFRDALGELHKNVGPQYIDTLLVPEMGAHIREEFARYLEHDLYTIKREEIQDRLLRKMRANSSFSYQFREGQRRPALFIEDVLVLDIRLPRTIAKAIEDKLAEEQHMLQYVFRLQLEEKEAKRKEIEAEGIRRFQEIVTGGISDRYLRWKGIDATLELARSNNTKVVVIGSGTGGLPIILGGLNELAAAPAPGQSPATGNAGARAARSAAAASTGSSAGAPPPLRPPPLPPASAAAPPPR
ncbi:MAG TPA: SPFH domain-containing protein [Thermoanaerobaculia bacterium]|nr:SPFH domain-containing protein [Thermoanaerobaculia bacterium]